MLSKISWGQYVGAVTLLLAAYYLAIAILYYRNEIHQCLIMKLQKSRHNDDTDQFGDNAPRDEGAMKEIKDITQDLRYAVLERIGSDANKEELILLLQKRLSSYAGLKEAACREAINRFLILHAAEICNVTFDEYELNNSWNSILQ